MQRENAGWRMQQGKQARFVTHKIWFYKIQNVRLLFEGLYVNDMLIFSK